MRLTERQTRIRLGEAVAKAGGQAAFARTLGLPDARAQCLVSRSLLGRNRVSQPILAALGLRCDAGGDVRTDEAATLPPGAVALAGGIRTEPPLDRRLLDEPGDRDLAGLPPVGRGLGALARAIDSMHLGDGDA